MAVVATTVLMVCRSDSLGGIVDMMFGRILTVVTVVAAVLLLTFVNISSPSTTGPGGILAVFFLLYLVLVGLITWIIYGTNKLWSIVDARARSRRLVPANWPRSLLKSYYMASIVALAPIILIAIGSVGDVHWYELGLVAMLVTIGIFYVQKRM